MRKLERYEEAIKAYTSELSFQDSSIKALNNRAFCYSKLGKYNKAIEDYDAVLGLTPDNEHALHNKGISLQRMSKFDKVTESDIRLLSVFRNYWRFIQTL